VPEHRQLGQRLQDGEGGQRGDRDQPRPRPREAPEGDDGQRDLDCEQQPAICRDREAAGGEAAEIGQRGEPGEGRESRRGRPQPAPAVDGDCGRKQR
jgi:hypothetical protein